MFPRIGGYQHLPGDNLTGRGLVLDPLKSAADTYANRPCLEVCRDMRSIAKSRFASHKLNQIRNQLIYDTCKGMQTCEEDNRLPANPLPGPSRRRIMGRWTTHPLTQDCALFHLYLNQFNCSENYAFLYSNKRVGL